MICRDAGVRCRDSFRTAKRESGVCTTWQTWHCNLACEDTLAESLPSLRSLMHSPLAISFYVFAVVFAFLAAIVIGFRFLLRLGGRSQPDQPRTRLRSIASEALDDAGETWPRKQTLVTLAPPPLPHDDLDYHLAADEVLNPHSPYSISPPRRDEGEWSSARAED